MVMFFGLKMVVVMINFFGVVLSCFGEVFFLGYRKGECFMII